MVEGVDDTILTQLKPKLLVREQKWKGPNKYIYFSKYLVLNQATYKSYLIFCSLTPSVIHFPHS